jgi:hypothetical protein
MKTWENNSDADKLSYAAFALDYSSMLLSGIEAGDVDQWIISSTIEGCAKGGLEGCGMGLLAGLGFDKEFSGWLSVVGGPENLLGVFSFGVTALADHKSGYTSADLDKMNLSIGKDTIVSFRNMYYGQLPESHFDLWVSHSQVQYDADRLLGVKQGGSYEILQQGNLNLNNTVWAMYQFMMADW